MFEWAHHVDGMGLVVWAHTDTDGELAGVAFEPDAVPAILDTVQAIAAAADPRPPAQLDLTGLPPERAIALANLTAELIAAAEARGFARAVAALRDDDLYRRWTLAQVEPRTHVGRVGRDVCVDYLETLAVTRG